MQLSYSTQNQAVNSTQVNTSAVLTDRQTLILQKNPVLKPKSAIINLGRDPQSTSKKFKKTDDLMVIEELNARNWYITCYKEQKRQQRNKHRVGFQKYRAIYINDTQEVPVAGGKLTILQTGAHDGTTKQTLQLGFYNSVSLHHVVVAGDLFKWSLKHYAQDPEQLPKVLAQLKAKLPLVKLKIQTFHDTLLTSQQMEEFTKRAITLRYGDKYDIDYRDVLKAQRPEDQGNRLWKVYNRVHENLLHPDYTVGLKDKEGNVLSGRTRKPKTPTGINFILNFNVKMWNLAEEYALKI